MWERLPEVHLPVTLIVGERDGKFSGIASDMGRRLPDAEVVVVERAGHAVHLEAPARAAAAIRHLGGLSPGPGSRQRSRKAARRG